MRFICVVLFLNLAPFSSAYAFDEGKGLDADPQINTAPLRAKARFQPSNVPSGGTMDLLIDLDLVENYHAYVERFKIALDSKTDSPNDLRFSELKIAPVVHFLDSVTKTMKDGVENKGRIQVLVEVPQSLRPGSHTAKLKLTYQACTKAFCLFPKTIDVEASYRVVAGFEAPATAMSAREETSVQPTATTFDKALNESIWLALIVLFGMGFLTSLTPCIYPMIPITLAVLGARTQDQSKFKSFLLSVSYVLGIAFTYALLGLAAAKTGALFGSALSNIYVVTAIAIVFIIMALSMYGLFELQMPAFIRNTVGSARSSSGYRGAFATGLVAGIVASPCVGPVLVSVLTYIAQTGNLKLGFLFLFTFALGLGVLFIVLGTSSSLLSKLPKAGGWMVATKFIFGTAMVAMALYYIRPLYPVWLFHCLLGVSILAIASTHGAFDTGVTGSGRLRKGFALAAFYIGLVFALMGILSRAGIQLPAGALRGHFETGEAYAKLDWTPYSDDALQGAIAGKKPVLIDFYADWCGECKEIERVTLTDDRVREISKKFVLLKFDATEGSPALEKLKATYSVRGLPTLIFYDGSGKLRTDLTVTGFEDADSFLKRMLTSAQSSSVKP